jgi:hypothetical protein
MTIFLSRRWGIALDRTLFFSLLTVTCALLAFTGCGSPSNSSPSNSSDPQFTSAGTVSPTAHPLVADYSVTAPAGGQLTVEFGTSTLYGRTTSARAVTAGQMVNVLVAGMHPQTTYHMRARLDGSGGRTYLDTDQTFQTGSLPSVTFPTASVTPAGDSASGGVDLISAFGTTVTAVVFDTDGSILWYYYDPAMPAGESASPIKQLDNGNFLINAQGDVREVDLSGQILRQITFAQLNSALAAAGYSLQAANIHHDLLELANGHWILLVNENKDFQDLPGYPGTTTVVGDAIVDLDTNNQVAWVWRAFDHLDVNRHPYQFPDWTHANTLVYEADGSLLLSMRNQSWVLKIDYADGSGAGDIIWRLGAGGDFTLSSTDPAQWFYNQHYPYIVQDSGSTQQIAIYDNGNTRPDSTGQPCTDTCYSRGLIMSIDESARTANITWQYSPGWFSFWGGSIVVLPNNNVEFDSTVPNAGLSKVVEATPGSSPQTVWQMNSSNVAFYRAYRIPSLYPGVRW